MDTLSDHYNTLGVPRDAADEDIERARKLLSRHWHPDSNKRPDAVQHFIEIQLAAEVLLDHDRRKAYDRDLETASQDASHPDNDGHDFAHDQRTEIVVEPSSIDFGALKVGGPSADAEIVMSWTGPPPGIINRKPQSGDWWENVKVDASETSVSFKLRAQARGETLVGKRRSHIDILVDGNAHRVPLVAQVVGSPAPPRPPHNPPSYKPTPPPRPTPTVPHPGSASPTARTPTYTAPTYPAAASSDGLRTALIVLLFPVRLVLGVAAIALGAAFLAGPWYIMAKTGLVHNSDAIRDGGLVEAICGIWALAGIILAIPALSGLLAIFAWIFSGHS